MPLITLSSGLSFVASGGASILDAAMLAKVALPYSCKTGRCSACMCRIKAGTTGRLRPELGLSDKQKSEGWILSCARAAESDLLLEVDNLAGAEMPVAKTWACRISRITRLASDVVQVFLRLPPHSDFQFIPGQYINVIGPSGIRRSYSIANGNFAEKLLELHVRQVRGGAMSDYWFNLAKANDLLRFNGPHGTFFLRATSGVDLIFLATGTGIAPVKSILESMSGFNPEQRAKSTTVLWGGRGPDDLYLNVADIPGVHTYVPVHSRATTGWKGAQGYVQKVLLDMKPDLKRAAIYACGSDIMIRDAKNCLIQAGLAAERFYSDAFVSSESN